MAKPIAPTPALKGEAARRFVEAMENPAPLKPVKVLTKRQAAKLMQDLKPETGK